MNILVTKSLINYSFQYHIFQLAALVCKMYTKYSLLAITAIFISILLSPSIYYSLFSISVKVADAEYDFIIGMLTILFMWNVFENHCLFINLIFPLLVGGGTTGLVIANRLTEIENIRWLHFIVSSIDYYWFNLNLTTIASLCRQTTQVM